MYSSFSSSQKLSCTAALTKHYFPLESPNNGHHRHYYSQVSEVIRAKRSGGDNTLLQKKTQILILEATTGLVVIVVPETNSCGPYQSMALLSLMLARSVYADMVDYERLIDQADDDGGDLTYKIALADLRQEQIDLLTVINDSYVNRTLLVEEPTATAAPQPGDTGAAGMHAAKNDERGSGTETKKEMASLLDVATNKTLEPSKLGGMTTNGPGTLRNGREEESVAASPNDSLVKTRRSSFENIIVDISDFSSLPVTVVSRPQPAWVAIVRAVELQLFDKYLDNLVADALLNTTQQDTVNRGSAKEEALAADVPDDQATCEEGAAAVAVFDGAATGEGIEEGSDDETLDDIKNQTNQYLFRRRSSILSVQSANQRSRTCSKNNSMAHMNDVLADVPFVEESSTDLPEGGDSVCDASKAQLHASP